MLLAGGEFGDLRRLYREQAKQVMYSNNILYLIGQEIRTGRE
jgi:hypothetical protein